MSVCVTVDWKFNYNVIKNINKYFSGDEIKTSIDKWGLKWTAFHNQDF